MVSNKFKYYIYANEKGSRTLREVIIVLII
jgi:hypothetical protein